MVTISRKPKKVLWAESVLRGRYRDFHGSVGDPESVIRVFPGLHSTAVKNCRLNNNFKQNETEFAELD
jgi:hypothetical protein